MDFINMTNRITPVDKSLMAYFEDLRTGKYQIPTFQRDVVWEGDRVKKLWDSIFKFYPLGSILVWNTEMKLQKHRAIGGFVLPERDSVGEYQYILDGQQRTTSLFQSLDDDSENALYVDLTVGLESETDDEAYKSKFLFWSDIDDKGGIVTRNVRKLERYKNGLIVRLIDVVRNFGNLFNTVIALKKDAEAPEVQELLRVQSIINSYRLSFIELRGIKVAEVCQIFERINQAGKPLDIFDIVVAKTFVPDSAPKAGDGFYLRDLIDSFREEYSGSPFVKLSDLDYLRTLAVLIRENIPGSGVNNITDIYLNEIRTDLIQAVWPEAEKAIRKTFDFFENWLHLQPYLIPYGYFYFAVAAYFYGNNEPDYEFLTRYFWYTSFHNSDLLSNTTQLRTSIQFLKNNDEFKPFVLDRERLRSAKYSSAGRMSRAVLALFANKEPRDWADKVRKVNVQNFFVSTDRPNLHHIFPTNSDFVLKHGGVDQNSLMNIAFITQATNLDISNKSPVEYYFGN